MTVNATHIHDDSVIQVLLIDDQPLTGHLLRRMLTNQESYGQGMPGQ